VVDCSGSMHGTSMEQARRTLLLCLQSLEPGDRFNVVRFGSTWQRLFKRSRRYDDEHLVRGVARASGGAAEFVYPGESVEDKVLRHFGRIAAADSELSVSFRDLAVEDRTDERARLRRIPVALTSGWGGIDGIIGSGPMASPPPWARPAPDAVCNLSGLSDMVDARVFEEADIQSSVRETRRSARRGKMSAPPDPFATICFSQNANGSWDLSRELVAECGVDPAVLGLAADEVGERVLATLLVLLLSEGRSERERKTLRHVLGKAARWLEAELDGRVPPEPHDTWEAWAAGLVGGA